VADAAVIGTKLEQIEQYHSELRAKQDLERKTFLEDITQQRAVERMFENAIQASADLAKHIASTDFEYEGTTSKGAVKVLRDNGVIREETASTLIDAVGFRNILAHEYGTVRPKQVYEYLQTDLGVYDDFSRQVATWWQEHAN